MNAANENWYVYYPAPSAPEPALAEVRQMQRELEAASGVRARMEARVDAERPTWMEVYEGVRDPADFAMHLAALAAARLPPELTTARRVERFRLI